MSNALVAPTQQTSAIQPLQVMTGTLVVRKDYANGGGSVKWMAKADFKKQYLAQHPGASGRKVTEAFNEKCKAEGEISRRRAVSFFSNPDVLVNGGRVNKTGDKGAISFCLKSAIKAPKSSGKKTVTADEVKSSLTKFTKADLATMQSEIAKLMAQ